MQREENEVKEDAASQVNRVLKGIEKDPRAQKSFEKSAKKRKGPGTDKDRAADLKLRAAKDAADTSKSDSTYAYEEKVLANVIGNLKKDGAVMASDLPKATDAQKAEWKAERVRRAAQRKPSGNPYKARQGESD